MHDEVIYLSTGTGILNHQQYGLDNKSIPFAEGVLQYEMHLSSMIFLLERHKKHQKHTTFEG